VSPEEQKVVKASADLEDLAAELRDIINEMRQRPTDTAYAYALTYNFRTDLGRVVASLGAGKPSMKVMNGKH
jgi:hypothetical protein